MNLSRACHIGGSVAANHPATFYWRTGVYFNVLQKKYTAKRGLRLSKCERTRFLNWRNERCRRTTSKYMRNKKHSKFYKWNYIYMKIRATQKALKHLKGDKSEKLRKLLSPQKSFRCETKTIPSLFVDNLCESRWVFGIFLYLFPSTLAFLKFSLNIILIILGK